MRVQLSWILALALLANQCMGSNLLTVFNDALTNDSVFQQAIAHDLSLREERAISIGNLLPTLGARLGPSLSRDSFSGSAASLLNPFGAPNGVLATNGSTSLPPNLTQRSFSLELKVTQVIFDYAKFVEVSENNAVLKRSCAELNAALQDLMLRTSDAYFAQLQAEENVKVNEVEKAALTAQLHQIQQKYKVNMARVSELDAAQAAFDNAVANTIAANSDLMAARENLHIITRHYYPTLADFNAHFPLTGPLPSQVETWIKTAMGQNWLIKAEQYKLGAAREHIKKAYAAHFPTVNVEGIYARHYSNTINGYTGSALGSGPGDEVVRVAAITIQAPLLAGGTTLARTRQATYDMQEKEQHLDQVVLETIAATRKQFYGVLQGMSQVRADQQSLKSARSSLQSILAAYHEGKETVFNVLNQRKNVNQSELKLQTDRLEYVKNYLALKKSAGTLSTNDLSVLNAWLTEA